MKKALLIGLAAATIFTGCNVSKKLGNISVIQDKGIQLGNVSAFQLDITNGSGSNVTAIYMSHSSKVEWGSSLGTITNNASKTLTSNPTNISCSLDVDIRFVHADGNETIRYNQNFGCDKAHAFTIQPFG